MAMKSRAILRMITGLRRLAALRTARSACAGVVALAAIFAGLLTRAPVVQAQGSRKDDIVFGPEGRPVSGATVRVCQPAATGTPCTPLATIYTDATLGVAAANPFQTDGIGNYHFYAPAGRYLIQISSPQISGNDHAAGRDSAAGFFRSHQYFRVRIEPGRKPDRGGEREHQRDAPHFQFQSR
jgi:hypothetical protein